MRCLLTAALIVVTLASPALAWDDDDDDYRPPSVQFTTPRSQRSLSLPRYYAPPPEAPPLYEPAPRYQPITPTPPPGKSSCMTNRAGTVITCY